jgi:hypothetical protein
MPAKLIHTTLEAKKEAHRIAALKYAQKNAAEINAYCKKRYDENKEVINARRKVLRDAKKAALVV